MARNNSQLDIHDYLSSFEMPGVSRAEREAYLSELMPRLLITMHMLPPATPGARLLELGASPYYMTLWLQRNTQYKLSLANFHDTRLPEGTAHLSSDKYGESYTFHYRNFNVETDRFPIHDGEFDAVLCCEILEHLTCDPTHMLVEIHRVLKSGGYLLLTTPNVLVWRHIILMLKHGKNIYHPYSGYGVYGRHNREYTLDEIVQLLTGCGYEIVDARAEDTYPHRGYTALLKRFFPRFRDNLFVLARAVGSPRYYYPEELYWAIHAIRRVTSADVRMGINDVGHLGVGWLPPQRDGDVNYRPMEMQATITLRARGDETHLLIEARAPSALTTDVTLHVSWNSERRSVYFSGGEWHNLRVPLTPPPGELELHFHIDAAAGDHPVVQIRRVGLFRTEHN